MPKARPKVQSNSVVFGLRAPGVGRRPSAQARRFYKPRYSLSAYNCSPPAVSATSSAELQPAAWGGGELRGSASRTSTASIHRPHSTKFVLGRATRSQFKRPKPGLLRVETGSKRRCASLRGGRLRPARPQGPQEHFPKHGQKPSPIHRPKNEHSPKLAPVLCPVSASLRFRFRFFRRRRAIRSLPRIELFLLASRCLRLPVLPRHSP